MLSFGNDFFSGKKPTKISPEVVILRTLSGTAPTNFFPASPSCSYVRKEQKELIDQGRGERLANLFCEGKGGGAEAKGEAEGGRRKTEKEALYTLDHGGGGGGHGGGG